MTHVLKTTLGIPWWPTVHVNPAYVTTTLTPMWTVAVTRPLGSASNVCLTLRDSVVRSVSLDIMGMPPPRAVWSVYVTPMVQIGQLGLVIERQGSAHVFRM